MDTDFYSSDGRFEIISFYQGDFFEIIDGQDEIFYGSREQLEEFKNLIQKGLDNSGLK